MVTEKECEAVSGDMTKSLFHKYAAVMRQMISEATTQKQALALLLDQLFVTHDDGHITIHPKLTAALLSQLKVQLQKHVILLTTNTEKYYQKALELYKAILEERTIDEANRQVATLTMQKHEMERKRADLLKEDIKPPSHQSLSTTATASTHPAHTSTHTISMPTPPSYLLNNNQKPPDGTNSHSTNSHSTNSHGTNSHSTNSHSTNSHSTNSHSTNNPLSANGHSNAAPSKQADPPTAKTTQPSVIQNIFNMWPFGQTKHEPKAVNTSSTSSVATAPNSAVPAIPTALEVNPTPFGNSTFGNSTSGNATTVATTAATTAPEVNSTPTSGNSTSGNSTATATTTTATTTAAATTTTAATTDANPPGPFSTATVVTVPSVSAVVSHNADNAINPPVPAVVSNIPANNTDLTASDVTANNTDPNNNDATATPVSAVVSPNAVTGPPGPTGNTTAVTDEKKTS
jgi:hypothetical protein